MTENDDKDTLRDAIARFVSELQVAAGMGASIPADRVAFRLKYYLDNYRE